MRLILETWRYSEKQGKFGTQAMEITASFEPCAWFLACILKAGFILHARVYARIRRLSAQLFILLSPVAPSAYARIRRLSPTKFKLVELSRPAQAFQPITKALQGHRGLTRCSDRDVCGRIPTHTLACLYFYPRRNLRYAVATHRQPQAWTSAPAAGAYPRMEYKPGLTLWPLGDLDVILKM